MSTARWQLLGKGARRHGIGTAAVRKRVGVALLFIVPMSSVAGPAGMADGRSIVLHGNGTGASACARCHGANGAGNAAAGFPRLAGIDAAYLTKQLDDFASGQRENPVMQAIARALTPDQRRATAAYFAARALPSGPRRSESKLLAQGRKLATLGDWSRNIPACVQCHGPGARGVPPHFPALAGQHAAYVEAQIQAWKKGSRRNDPDGLMRGIAARLSAGQVRAVAAYLEDPDIRVVHHHPDGALPARQAAPADGTRFRPPADAQIPDNAFGRMVRRGESLFVDTQQLRGKYVGNGLSCVNCHLDRGRRAGAAPMWAAYVHYPAFRRKTGTVSTLAERIQGCFRYSENGTAPAADGGVIKALETYFFWMAKGAPVGAQLQGRGYPKLTKPVRSPDVTRGAKVFEVHCAICHGASGQGYRFDGKYIFPPLWGSESYNWGAGMHRIDTAAAFIKANMPLSEPERLTLQQAWDVAAFVNSHERPQDPRFKGSVQATRKAYHRHDCLYGRRVRGRVLGTPP